jgi:hypothetical protein
LHYIKTKRLPKKSFYCAYAWLGQRFWNQTFEEVLVLNKDQTPVQEIQEIRQLLDEEAGVVNIIQSTLS